MPILDLSPLTAISPIDGRYASKTQALRDSFSEYGLIRNRISANIQKYQKYHPLVMQQINY